MFIVLCTLLAASPVHPSLLPRSTAVRLLDESTQLPRDEPAQDDGNRAPWGVRIAAEAGAGALLATGLGAGGLFLGSNGGQGGFSSLGGALLLGFLGFEIGEIVGITLAGSALGWRGTAWGVVLGNLLGFGAMLVLAPVLGPLFALAAFAGPVVGQSLAFAGLGLLTVACGVAGGELLATNRTRPLPSATPAAVTIRF